MTYRDVFQQGPFEDYLVFDEFEGGEAELEFGGRRQAAYGGARARGRPQATQPARPRPRAQRPRARQRARPRDDGRRGRIQHRAGCRCPQCRAACRRSGAYRGRRPAFVGGLAPWVDMPPEGSEQIRWVQQALNAALGLRLPVNGVNGPETRSAIRSFQQRQGLPADGVAGPPTEQALAAASGGDAPDAAPDAGPDAAPDAGPDAAPDAGPEEEAWDSEISRSSSTYIRWVQQSLNRVMGLRLVEDGIAGTQTRSAIRSFQQQNGLAMDGIVGSQTEGALIAAGAGNPPGSGISPYLPPSTPAQPPVDPGSWVLPNVVRADGEAQFIRYDSPPPWNSGTNCTGSWTPGAIELRDYILATFRAVNSIGGYACRQNTANLAETSVHGTGRALDIMIAPTNNRANRAVGDPIANWLVQSAEAIGVQYIIWNRTQWSGSRSGRKDRPYSGPNPHIDHIHVELNRDGAARSTPWFLSRTQGRRNGETWAGEVNYKSPRYVRRVQQSRDRISRVADEIDGAGDTRIIDLTAKADKSQRKGTRDPKSVYALVLHQMACCFTVKDPLKRFLSIGSHFAILPDGRILQLHPISALVWASNGFNNRSVAVEFAGNFPNTKGKCWEAKKFGCHQVTQAQIEAGRYLVRYLIRTMGLTHIVAHRQSSGTRENDPGPDIWYNVGQWAIDNLGLKDGGPGFKIGTGNPIPDLWRNWGRVKPQPELEVGGYEIDPASLEHTRWLQRALNRSLGLRLPEDGVISAKVRSALRTFQQRRGLPTDSELTDELEEFLVAEGAVPHRHPGG